MTTLFRTLQSFISVTRKANPEIDSLIKEAGYRNTSLKGVTNILELMATNGYSTKVYLGVITPTAKVEKVVKQFNGMTYRQLQVYNKAHFGNLSKDSKTHLKNLGYRNSGWDNMIHSYQLLQSPHLELKSDEPQDEPRQAKSKVEEDNAKELVASLHIDLEDHCLDDFGPLVIKRK